MDAVQKLRRRDKGDARRDRALEGCGGREKGEQIREESLRSPLRHSCNGAVGIILLQKSSRKGRHGIMV